MSRSSFGNCCKKSDTDDDAVMHGKRYHIQNSICCPYSAARVDDDNNDDPGAACEPSEVFWNDVSTTFSCEIDRIDDPLAPPTVRRCYLNQAHTTDPAGIPFTCHVGNCLYNVSAKPPIPTGGSVSKPQSAATGGDVDLGHPVRTAHGHQETLVWLALLCSHSCAPDAILIFYILFIALL